jgi:hypothetical protein
MECYKEWTASHLDKLPCADVDDTQCWEDELANNPPCGDKSEDECKAAMLDDIVPNVKRVIDEDWVTFCFDVGDGTGDYLHITECIGVVLGDDEDGTDGNGDNSDGNGDNSDGKGDNSNDSGNGNGNDSGNGGDPNPP